MSSDKPVYLLSLRHVEWFTSFAFRIASFFHITYTIIARRQVPSFLKVFDFIQTPLSTIMTDYLFVVYYFRLFIHRDLGRLYLLLRFFFFTVYNELAFFIYKIIPPLWLVLKGIERGRESWSTGDRNWGNGRDEKLDDWELKNFKNFETLYCLPRSTNQNRSSWIWYSWSRLENKKLNTTLDSLKTDCGRPPRISEYGVNLVVLSDLVRLLSQARMSRYLVTTAPVYCTIPHPRLWL